MGARAEVLEKFALGFKKIEEAATDVEDFLGMQACDGTGRWVLFVTVFLDLTETELCGRCHFGEGGSPHPALRASIPRPLLVLAVVLFVLSVCNCFFSSNGTC